MNRLRHLREFFIGSARKYILGIVTLILVDALLLVTPKILGIVVDLVKSGNALQSDLVFYAALIVGLAAVIAALRFSWRMLITGESRKLEYWLRNKLFEHLTTLDADFYANHKTGDLMAHATNDIGALRSAFGIGVVIVTDSIFISTSTVLIMALTISPELTLVSLFPLPAVAVFMSYAARHLQKRFKDVQDTFSTLSEGVQESFSGIRVIKSYVREEYELDKFNRANKLYMDKNLSLIKLWGLIHPLIGFVMSASYILALYFGGSLVMDGSITLGSFMSFVTYLGLLTFPLLSVGWITSLFQRGSASLGRLNAIFDTSSKISDAPDARAPEIFKPSIEFECVSFKYPDALSKSLDDISFKIEPGKTLGIVGRTGSGKTTVMNLMMRLHDVHEGSVKISGIEIGKLPLQFIRTRIAAVPQDSFLFSDTIRSNISFANDSLSDEDLERVSKTAGIYSDIMDFPDGFDTVIGERGVTLSGGQKQRVSIARALASGSEILIFDDCLSAVDTSTESRILSELKKATRSKTTIIIAHRISTVKHSDTIVVMDEGRVVESGTHESLLELGGEYRKMFESQLLEEMIVQSPARDYDGRTK